MAPHAEDSVVDVHQPNNISLSQSTLAPHADNSLVGSGIPANPYHVADVPVFKVVNDNVKYTDSTIETVYTYQKTVADKLDDGTYEVKTAETKYDVKTDRTVPKKLGLLLVGLGGNNGSTFVAGLIANKRKLSWETKEGFQKANWYGSLTQASTARLAQDSKTGADINIPIHAFLPMVKPEDIVVSGWDISSMNLADAMDRACVLEPTLKYQVRKEMAQMKPMPSIYYPDFIAANQEDRADNLIPGSKASMAHVEQIRKDIR